MDRATSKGKEAKSKMKHPSDVPTPRFELRWYSDLWSVQSRAYSRSGFSAISLNSIVIMADLNVESEVESGHICRRCFDSLTAMQEATPDDQSFDHSDEDDDFFVKKQLVEYLLSPSTESMTVAIWPLIKRLFFEINTLLSATAACERLFSAAVAAVPVFAEGFVQ